MLNNIPCNTQATSFLFKRKGKKSRQHDKCTRMHTCTSMEVVSVEQSYLQKEEVGGGKKGIDHHPETATFGRNVNRKKSN